MTKVMPIQKPGRSVQEVATPPELLNAVKDRLCIGDFSIDLAASEENKVCPTYFSAGLNDALAEGCIWSEESGGWAWCNPPYANIGPWVEKACNEAVRGAQIVMLVPASVGSNWWRDWVEPFAYQVFLNGRVTFVGHTAPYPKDLALLLYAPWFFHGYEIWNWNWQ
jgi:phage N-6-adenine-methyltransferase